MTQIDDCRINPLADEDPDWTALLLAIVVGHESHRTFQTLCTFASTDYALSTHGGNFSAYTLVQLLDTKARYENEILVYTVDLSLMEFMNKDLDGRISGATGAEKTRLQAVKKKLEGKMGKWNGYIRSYKIYSVKVCVEIANR